MVVTHFGEGQEHPSGTLVDNRTYAPFHQHLLVAGSIWTSTHSQHGIYSLQNRDGLDGSGESAPGLALHQKKTPGASRRGARRLLLGDPAGVDCDKRQFGQRPRYPGVIQAGARRRSSPRSLTRPPGFPARGGHWALGLGQPNDAEERWPAGEFVNQGTGGLGMPEWVRKGRSVKNTEVVLWYVFGIHHITRPERMAGDAGGYRRVLAQAGGLLRSEPITGRLGGTGQVQTSMKRPHRAG